MRIPKKTELIELQKKYRTDKKIGEVYGVPARLVAYWRGKKKIGAYSFPKYNEEKIQELWERFGDDSRAGEELGISKAGFRQWRRKYHIDQKPLQLRLEQLELPLLDSIRRKNSRRETIIQKILARKSGLKKAAVGEVVNAEVDLVISHDNSGAIIQQFSKMGGEKIVDSGKIVMALDQVLPVNTNGSFTTHKAIREFAKKHKIKNFYDVGEGIGHQLAIENGHVLPGQLVLTAGSHATAYGSLGAVSAAINSVEAAAIWATGRLWLRVPETVRVIINGRMGRGIFAKDIIMRLSRELATHNTGYKILEFYGPVVSSLSISERFTLASLSSSDSAKSVVVPFDDITARFLRRSAKTKFFPVAADSDAEYQAEIELDVSYLMPQVSCLHESGKANTVEEFAGKKVEQVILGGCTNGRIEDLETMARIFRGRRVNRDTRVIIIPGSRRILSEALDRGFIRTFIDSGCIIQAPGCGSCIHSHYGILEPDEKLLTTVRCDCRNGCGECDNEVYLASPATAAATAIEGAIADPRKYIK